MSVNGGASRRALLLGAGAVGAAGVLAACGGDESNAPRQPAPGTTPGGGDATTPGGPTSGAPGTTSSAAAPDGIPVAQVPVGGGHVDSARRVVVTQPQAGEFRAFDAVCTHEQCLVSSVADGMINCTCHGSQFRISDGSVARGPAARALGARTTTVTDGVVVIS